MSLINRSKKDVKIKSEFQNEIPQAFRVRILHLWNDATGGFPMFDNIVAQFIRKKGLFRLGPHDWQFDNMQDYLLNSNSIDCIEFIEFVFNAMEKMVAGLPTYEEINGKSNVNYAAYNIKNLISELNRMLTESNLGYQFLNGRLIRREDEYSYAEIIEPATKLLLDHKFEGAAEEFSIAHEHYRAGRMKECITECNKAFESIMKTICELKKLKYNKNSQAKELIDILVKNDVIPSEQLSYFTSLRALLESGLPTLRNKKSAHGQGSTITVVPKYIAQYALNLTASNILFLMSASYDL